MTNAQKQWITNAMILLGDTPKFKSYLLTTEDKDKFLRLNLEGFSAENAVKHFIENKP